jgi:hypothetical protein
MPIAPQTANLTTTGATPATGIAMLSKPQTDTLSLWQISGTYGTVTGVFEGTLDAAPASGGNWFTLTAIPLTTSAATASAVAPADNSTVGWAVPCAGLTAVRFRVTAIASGTAIMTYSSTTVIDGPHLNQSITSVGSSSPVFTGTVTEAAPGASTPAAGTTTTDAGVLPAGTSSCYPTTAADGTKGVRINAADQVTGRRFLIGNGVSNQTLKVYAPSGGTINGAAADAAYVTASGKGAYVECLSGAGNTWFAIG